MTTCLGSLEDCQTNVFSLTELAGLKWKRLTTPDEYVYPSDVDQDPIIKAFRECVANNIYATWRRRRAPDFTDAPLLNNTIRSDQPKELFLFWFTADEPALIAKLLEEGLIAPDETEFTDQVIKYETRTLFYKALHYVFERNLWSSGYVKFGKWFVKPLEDQQDAALPSHVHAYNANFQCLGENHVCMILKVQRQDPVIHISKRILELNRPISVILGPWSIRATLLPEQPFHHYEGKPGRDYSKASEVQSLAAQQFDMWKRLFPCPSKDDEQMDVGQAAWSKAPKKENQDVPKFLYVEIDGVKMMCPSYMVCVLSAELDIVQNSSTRDHHFMDKSENEDPGLREESLLTQLDRRRRRRAASQKMETYVPDSLIHNRKSHVGLRIGSKNFEDASLNGAARQSKNSNSSGMHLQITEDVRWNVVDSIPKQFCYCNKVCSSSTVPGSPVTTRPAREQCVFHHLQQPQSSIQQTISNQFVQDLQDDPHLNNAIASLVESSEDAGRETPAFARTVHHSSRKVADRIDLESPITDLAQSVDQCLSNLFSTEAEDVPYPEPVRSFSPVTNITSPTSEDVDCEKYRNYSYHYNALKRDVINSEDYHYEHHRQKPLGPLLLDYSLTESVSTSRMDMTEVDSKPVTPLSTLRKSTNADEWLKHVEGCLKKKNNQPTEVQGSVKMDTLKATDQVEGMDTSAAPTVRRRRLRRDSRTTSLSPVRNYDPLRVSVQVNVEDSSCFVHKGDMENVVDKDDNECDGCEEKTVKESSQPDELVKTVFDDTVDFDDPKTPGSTNCGDDSQIFSSASLGSDQILSPPASNERVEMNTATGQTLISQTQSLPAQSLISVQNAESIVLHANSWNTGNVNVNNANDNLSAIYPTPPTPMQQFSPLNFNAGEENAKRNKTEVEELVTRPVIQVFSQYRQQATWELNENSLHSVFSPAELKLPPVFDEFCSLQDKRSGMEKKSLRNGPQRRNFRTPTRHPPSFVDLQKHSISKKTIIPRGIVALHRKPAKMAEYALNMKRFNRLNKSYGFGILKAVAFQRRQIQLHRESQQRATPQHQLQQNRQMYANQPGMPNQMMNMGMPRPQFTNMMPQQAYHNSPMMRQQFMSPPGQPPMNPQQQFLMQQQMMQMKQQQHMAQRYPGLQQPYFNTPSPASSLNSNPQSVPPAPQLDQGGNAGLQPQMLQGQMGGPSPFGSPIGNQMIGSVGQSNFPAHRTPGSMPNSVLNSVDQAHKTNSVFSNPDLSLSVPPASGLYQATLEEFLRELQNNKLRSIATTMQDTIFDLFFDTVFDACPICSCNANIRSADLGHYIQVPHNIHELDEIFKRQQADPRYKPDFWSGLMKSTRGLNCSCGFSAVRYRILSAAAQCMFPDDAREANTKPVKGLRHPSLGIRKIIEMVDVVRFLSWTYGLNRIAFPAHYLGDIPERLERPTLFASPDSNYVVSRVEAEEFDVTISSLLQSKQNQRKPLFHPWGLQVAQAVKEPKDIEYMAVVREILPILELSIKQIRGSEFTGHGNIVEGPLTWRQFHKKAVKSNDDDSHKPEQVPHVLVTADRELVTTNPQLIHMWEKLTMAPYDQPKDVLYLAVAPETNVVVEKVKVFMEDVSATYEKCRFGRHVKLMSKDAAQPIRDGILRVSGTKQPTSEKSSVQQVNGQSEEEQRHWSKMNAFAENAQNALKAFFAQNDYVFERRSYFETLYKDSLQPHSTSLASNSDASNMPPPPPPSVGGVIKSPSSVLSTQSGPASHGQLQSAGQPVATPPNQSQQSPMVSGQMGPHSNEGMVESIRTPENPVGTPNSQDPQQAQADNTERAVAEMLSEDIPHALPHLIVIYVVNPFSFGTEGLMQNHKINTLLMVRFIENIMKAIRPERRHQVQIEILNAQTVFDYTTFVSSLLREDRQTLEPVEVINREKNSAQDVLRRLAFSVYCQTRHLVPENVRGVLYKSMTRFGPSASMSEVLDDLKLNRDDLYFKVPCAPYVLAPRNRIGMTNTANKFNLLNPEERVLFVSYCLLGEDILIASITDQFGHLHDNTLINMHVNIEHGRKFRNKSQVYDGIYRLWLFIQSCVVMDTRNCRLVITRVGKIGHGEFRAWSQFLSKKNLGAFNSNLRGKDKEGPSAGSTCRTCAITPNTQEVPVIMSACLVSMEAEPHLRVFPSFVVGQEPKARGSGKNNNTSCVTTLLEDTSITHIITFPTSPEICTEQSGQQQDNDDNFNLDFLTADNDMEEEGMGDLLNNTDFEDDPSRQEMSFDHQPMATGYLVTTAPATELPDWFWATCPNAKRHLPVHIRNALHINSSSVHDDMNIGQKTDNENFHPLDETQTDFILRYVMQVHNALSWLNVDVGTGARHSCLPVHMQALFRLYHNVEKSIP